MDRPLDEHFRRKRNLRRALRVALAVALTSAALIWVPGWIAPSVSRDRIRTATVDVGPIEAAITASGTVVPEFEQVLSSPVETRVVKILSTPGAVLTRGQAILDLDVSESLLAFENTLNNLRSQHEIKTLERQYNEATYLKSQKMFQRGLIPEDPVRQAKLSVDKTAVELKQLEDAMRNTRQTIAAQLDGWVPEAKILSDDPSISPSHITLAALRADRDGVLTWVTPQEGVAVHRGEVLARIADLSAFHVEATVSDVHATRLSPGLPVLVKANDDTLAGTISRVLPTVQDGVIPFHVRLEDRSSKALRANLRVDVFVITDRRPRVLRLKRGPAINGEGQQDLFVIRGGVAVKTPVRIGLLNFDQCEVLDGLIEGDEVILSDMSDYMHMKEVKVK